MQQLLSLAVLLGAMLHLQGCGGGDETTTAAPATETTATPTTATPTVAPTVLESGFKLDGMTKAQAESVKPAIEKGIADNMGLSASAVTITSITEASRRLDGRALTSHESTSLDIVFQATVPADKLVAVQAKAAAAVADGGAALLTAVKAAVEADPDAPAAVKSAMAAATLSGFVAPSVVTPVDSNSTRRLSFSFITSDEPLIL